MSTTKPILPKKNYQSAGSRDYVKTADGEVWSINGLYCDADGRINSYGSHIVVIDVRWTVVVWQDCWIGRDEDFTPIYERRLVFNGDNTDEAILARYGYRVERDKEGYRNILPLDVMSDEEITKAFEDIEPYND